MTRHRASVVYGLVTLAICLLALSSSCGSNGNAGLPAELRITSVDIPAGNGGETVTWTVSWEGGIAPYTISIDTGGGALENLPAGTPAHSPFQADFVLVNGSFYLAEIHAYLVVVTDANGNTAVAQGSYDVEPAEPPQLIIKHLSYDADSGLLRIAADTDGWGALLAQLTLPAGWTADASEREMTVSENEAIAEFYVYPEDVLAGGAGEFDMKVFDPDEVLIEPVEDTLTAIPNLITLGEGVLAAIPVQRHLRAGEYTYVQVVCGDFPPETPFKYMNGTGVTVDDGAEYVDTTFNVGAPGGEGLDTDGIWAEVGALSFLIPFGGIEGLMIQENDIGGGRVRIDFNVTPIGGEEVTTGGALFNFALDFNEPGTYTLGFQEFDEVKRTYYSDTDSNEYYWADISNDYPGVPNTITVTP